MNLPMFLLVVSLCAAGQALPREDPDWYKQLIPRHAVYSLPGMSDVKVRHDIIYKREGDEELKMDVYTPPSAHPSGKLHAVVFIHGGFLPPNLLTQPKDTGIYMSYGRLAAAAGFAAITFNHRFYRNWNSLRDSTSDVAHLLEFVRTHSAEYGIDANHITLWALSAGGALLTAYLRDPQPYITSLVGYYAVLDLRPFASDPKEEVSQELAGQFSAAAFLSGAKGKAIPPIFIGRAGLDDPKLNRGLDDFVAAAIGANLMINVANHPRGEHGFDLMNDDARSREIMQQTIEFIRAH